MFATYIIYTIHSTLYEDQDAKCIINYINYDIVPIIYLQRAKYRLWLISIRLQKKQNSTSLYSQQKFALEGWVQRGCRYNVRILDWEEEFGNDDYPSVLTKTPVLTIYCMKLGICPPLLTELRLTAILHSQFAFILTPENTMQEV